MAKEVAKQQSQVAAVSELPSELRDYVTGEAQGLSSRAEDNLVPIIYILQAQSPQVMRGSERIEGAEAGDIWLRNAPDPIVKGDEGILFQPCHFFIEWVEWLPDRGGFAGRHNEKPAEAEEHRDPDNPNIVTYTMPNGNEVVETRVHVGIVHREGQSSLPFVIPMSSSGHTTSRTWMTLMNGKQDQGKRVDSWLQMWRLRTRFRENNKGQWYAWDFEDAGYVRTAAQAEAGKALRDAFASGEKQAEVPDTAPVGQQDQAETVV